MSIIVTKETKGQCMARSSGNVWTRCAGLITAARKGSKIRSKTKQLHKRQMQFGLDYLDLEHKEVPEKVITACLEGARYEVSLLYDEIDDLTMEKQDILVATRSKIKLSPRKLASRPTTMKSSNSDNNTGSDGSSSSDGSSNGSAGRPSDAKNTVHLSSKSKHTTASTVAHTIVAQAQHVPDDHYDYDASIPICTANGDLSMKNNFVVLQPTAPLPINHPYSHN